MSNPSPDLVRAAQQGEPAALDRLVEASAPLVLSRCIRLGGPRVDPDDAAQEVLLVVLDRLHALRDPERFDAWLFGIVRGVLANHRRRAWLRRWVSATLPQAVDPRTAPDRRADLSLPLAGMLDLLDTLPRVQREAFVLCELEEHTAVEAAAILGLPPGRVRSRLYRARRTLRAAVDALPETAAIVELVRGGEQ